MAVYSVKENYLSGISISNFDNNMSVMECSILAIAEAEDSFNNIMKETAIKELSVLESTGAEMIYEASEKDNLFNKVINWFKQRWADICGIFKKAIKAIDDKLDINKRFLKANEDKAKEGFKNLPADDCTVKGYTFNNLDNVNIKFTEALVKYKNLVKSATGYKDAFYSNKTEILDDAKADFDEFNKESKARISEFKNKLIIDGAGEADKFSVFVTEHLRGKEETDVKVTDINKIIDELSTGKTTKGEIKEAYNGLKKQINEMIKEVKDYQKACKPDDKTDKELYNLRMSYAGKLMSELRNISSISMQAQAAHIRVLDARFAQYRKMLALCVKYAPKKAKGTTSTGESAVDFLGSGLNLI